MEAEFNVEADPMARVVLKAVKNSRLRETFDGVGSSHFRDGKDPDAVLRKRDATIVATNLAVRDVLVQMRLAH